METTAVNDRHAYMILCHNRFDQLGILLEFVDDERNDIYIHVDKKATGWSAEELRSHVKKAGLFFTESISVSWGAVSMIEVVVLLLKDAIKTPHSYYHLISGMDLPIKTQDEIHRFFAAHNGKDFVSMEMNHPHNKTKQFMYRVDYYYRYQEIVGRNFNGEQQELYEKQKAEVYEQYKKGERRTEGLGIEFWKGSNWFSITHETACYVVEQYESRYREIFRDTVCSDELFLQTILINSPFMDRVEDNYLRFIDWTRAGEMKFGPYVLREEDFDLLINQGEDMLFARKFDILVDQAIIDKLSAYLKEKSGEC